MRLFFALKGKREDMQMGRGSMKSACLVFVFLSAACLWNISDAHPNQLDGNAAVTKINAVSTLKGDIEVVGPPTAIYEEKIIGGRKMGVHEMMKLEKVKVIVDGESGIGNSKTGLLSSSSNQLEGKSCGSDQVKWGTTHKECKQSGSTSFSETSVDDPSGFVAFNEDYHAARHHPPKNN